MKILITILSYIAFAITQDIPALAFFFWIITLIFAFISANEFLSNNKY